MMENSYILLIYSVITGSDRFNFLNTSYKRDMVVPFWRDRSLNLDDRYTDLTLFMVLALSLFTSIKYWSIIESIYWGVAEGDFIWLIIL